MKYSVTPVKIMDLSTDLSVLVYGNHFNEKVTVPVYVWLIQGNGKNILVDTGPDDNRKDMPEISGKIQNRLSLAEALRSADTAPEDIDTVILTHLHWDRCGNLGKFINAEIIVQSQEVDYANWPLPHHYYDYDSDITGNPPSWRACSEKMTMINGQREIAPGIKVLAAAGHTPGMQAVLIDNDKETFLIAGDNVPLDENWNGDGKRKHIPANIHYKLSEYYRTLEQFEDICDYLYPAHQKEPVKNKYRYRL